MQKPFHITLEIQHHPKTEAKRLVEGECDALWLASFAFRPDGSLSVVFDDIGELKSSEWLRIWVFLAKRLCMSRELNWGQRELCALVWERWNWGDTWERWNWGTFNSEIPPIPSIHYITYKLERRPEGLTLQEAQRRQVFASDAFILGLIRHADPGIEFVGVDGRNTDPMPDDLWWQVWAFLAKYLNEVAALTERERAMPAFVFQCISEAMAKLRGEPS